MWTVTPERIRVARKALNVTQSELANRIGVASSFIALVETKQRDIPKVREKQIREALDVTDEEIELLMSLEQRRTR
jgi:transcriptional regulator with XRE-family HTH domain